MKRTCLATPILAALDLCNRWQELEEFVDKALPQVRGTELRPKSLEKKRSRIIISDDIIPQAGLFPLHRVFVCM